MIVNQLKFGQIEIDGKEYAKDIVIIDGRIYERNKKPSKASKTAFGHTPLTLGENIPWNCKTLVIGTGHYERLPIHDDVRRTARESGVTLIELSTPKAVDHINDPDTNLILHLTC